MKKKFLITLLALVCAVCCAFGVTACGDGNGNQNGNGTDTSQSGGTSGGSGGETTGEDSGDDSGSGDEGAASDNLTDAQWTAALSESAFINFRATMTFTGIDEPLLLYANLADNAKYYYTDSTGSEHCYSKEGSDYFKYFKTQEAEKFTKTDKTQKEFEDQLKGLEQMTLLNFADKKEQFAFSDTAGGYFGEGITVGKDTCDVLLKFESGKVVYMDIDFGGDEHMTVEYIYGDINIDLPQDYIDHTGAKELANKKFLFNNVIGGSNPDAIKTTYKDAYIEFKDDGTFIYFIFEGNSHSGTYTFANGTGTINLEKLNGSENANPSTREFTYENNKVSLKLTETTTVIFALQAD